MGYPARYPILSGPISRDGIDKSSLNTIPFNWYRDGILMGYPVRRYIYEIVLNILMTDKIRIISRDEIFFSHFYLY